MKRLLKFIFVLPTLLFAFTSCEETESTEDMQYANWQARNSSYFTETMNTAKNAIAAAKAQYGNDWEAHCDWRIYCSMYNDATQTGSPTDSIAVFIKERGTGSGCPLYTDTVRVNFMTRTIPNELGEDAESKKLGKLVSYSGVSKNEADIFSPLYCMPNKVAVSNNVEGLTTALQYMHIGDRVRPERVGQRCERPYKHSSLFHIDLRHPVESLLSRWYNGAKLALTSRQSAT